MPERWHRKLRAVRSAVRIDASGPVDLADGVRRRRPRRRRRRASRPRSPGRPGGTSRRRTGRPASTPVLAGDEAPRRRGVRRQEGGGDVAQRPEVLGQGPRHRVADRGRSAGATVAHRPITEPAPPAQRVERRRGSRCGCGRPGSPRGRVAAATQRAGPPSRRLRSSAATPSGRRRRGAARARAAARPPATRRVAHHAGAGGHGPLQPRRAALAGVAPRGIGRGPAPRRQRPTEDARRRRRGRPAWRRSARGPSLPGGDGLDHPGREHHALEQRVGGQAVGAVHAGARRLAAGPQAGQRGGAVEVGDDAAGEVVGGGGDRAASRWPGRGRPPRSDGGDGREALVEALEAGGVEPQVVDALLEHAGGHGPADQVARRQLVDEALAVGVAQQRAVAPQRLGQQRPGHRPGGAARWGGTA